MIVAVVILKYTKKVNQLLLYGLIYSGAARRAAVH